MFKTKLSKVKSKSPTGNTLPILKKDCYLYYQSYTPSQIYDINHINETLKEKNRSLILAFPNEEVHGLYRDILEAKIADAVDGIQSSPDDIDTLKLILEIVKNNYVIDLGNVRQGDAFYIFGHGLPADGVLYADDQDSEEARGQSMFESNDISALALAQQLVANNLPPYVRVKMLTCNGANGKANISFPKTASTLNNMHQYIINNTGDFERSLAGILENELISLQPQRLRGNVFGYIGSLTLSTNSNIVNNKKGAVWRKEKARTYLSFEDHAKKDITFNKKIFRRCALGFL